MRAWSVDVWADNRADAIAAIMATDAPAPAKQHLAAVVASRDHVYVGERMPDRPIRVSGAGEEAAGIVLFKRARVWDVA